MNQFLTSIGGPKLGLVICAVLITATMAIFYGGNSFAQNLRILIFLGYYLPFIVYPFIILLYRDIDKTGDAGVVSCR